MREHHVPTVFDKYEDSFEYNWKDLICGCHIQHGLFIFDDPPNKCPYLLEQMLIEASSYAS